ncbi:MAG TPA: xanthine dehydrogenase family protein subunit M [Burkholderiales bacterium]|nr:xanthine dehydrogenase family protein subunit M [Burkholderiales bacterium]
MKFPDFRYAAPESVAEAVRLLASSEGAKPIAGGQSLLPMMAYRLTAPSLLVDLKKLKELQRLSIDADGVRLGARVRWRDIELDARLKTAHPLLQAAIAHTAHYQIRNRGTVGGSVAHADPAAEMPGIAATCDAEMTAVGPKGRRVIRAADFFLGPLSTALAPEELLVEVKLAPWAAGRRWGFEELARRRGDFAMAGVAAYYDLDAEGRATNAHIGVIGACTRPHRVAAAEAELNGKRIDAKVIAAAAKALAASVEPPEDLHASAEYRASLAGTLLERVLTHASR